MKKIAYIIIPPIFGGIIFGSVLYCVNNKFIIRKFENFFGLVEAKDPNIYILFSFLLLLIPLTVSSYGIFKKINIHSIWIKAGLFLIEVLLLYIVGILLPVKTIKLFPEMTAGQVRKYNLEKNTALIDPAISKRDTDEIMLLFSAGDPLKKESVVLSIKIADDHCQSGWLKIDNCKNGDIIVAYGYNLYWAPFAAKSQIVYYLVKKVNGKWTIMGKSAGLMGVS